MNARDTGTPLTESEFLALLRAARHGDTDAEGRLFECVRKELHNRAHGMTGRLSTMQTTAIVDDAFLKLVRGTSDFNDRRHFMRVACRAMVQVVCDYARRSHSLRYPADSNCALEEILRQLPRDLSVLAVEAGLARLREVDERAATVVEMRIFGGFRGHEIADCLQIDIRTVRRDWDYARAFLGKELS
jgi:RNA polymerase sigma factor (TIGR02999 family)